MINDVPMLPSDVRRTLGDPSDEMQTDSNIGISIAAFLEAV
jgi:hypothetical protein